MFHLSTLSVINAGRFASLSEAQAEASKTWGYTGAWGFNRSRQMWYAKTQSGLIISFRS